MWEKIKTAKWLALIIVVVVVALAAVTVMAATGWFGTAVPATGTISVTVPVTTVSTTSTTTTATTTTAADFNYTVSPSTLNFNDTVWATGSTVLVTCPVTIDNTGNQPINTFTVTATALPAWLHVSITNTSVAAGQSGQETVTLSGTAPAAAEADDLASMNVQCTLTPGS
jgi:hypothetical protein